MLKCLRQKINHAAWVLGLLAGWAGLCGCQSQPAKFRPWPGPGSAASAAAPTSTAPLAPAPDNSPSMELREGDTVRIALPGTRILDTVQTIRRDGKITLEVVGAMKAAGLTPHELEQQLLRAYYHKLEVKEVTVTVQTSVFVVKGDPL